MQNRWLINKQAIRKIVVDTAIAEEIVEEVVSHQFSSMERAFSNHVSVEFSGIGTFYVKKRSVEWMIQKYERLITSYRKIARNAREINNEKKEMRYLRRIKKIEHYMEALKGLRRDDNRVEPDY